MRPPLRPSCLKRTPYIPRLLRATPQSSLPCRIVTTSTTNTAPVDIPKLIVSPGSVHHNSLPSFLEYATRKNLQPSRTVYVGTHYEYTVALSLLRLGFSLLRVGRKSDAGIDLMGHWVLPPLREPMPVIVQCKARKTGCNPHHVRELEGSFQGIPAEWRNKDVLGLLVTTQNASKGTLETLGRSRWPLGFMKISKNGTIEQFVWNRIASERGLEGMGVTARYTPRVLLSGTEEATEADELVNRTRNRRKSVAEKSRTTGAKKDIQLTWMSSPIFPDRKDLDQETMKLMSVIAHEDENLTIPTRKTMTGAEGAVIFKAVKDSATATPKKRGRPLGSKNKTARPVALGELPRKRGRPTGSKNKTKDAISNG